MDTRMPSSDHVASESHTTYETSRSRAFGSRSSGVLDHRSNVPLQLTSAAIELRRCAAHYVDALAAERWAR